MIISIKTFNNRINVGWKDFHFSDNSLLFILLLFLLFNFLKAKINVFSYQIGTHSCCEKCSASECNEKLIRIFSIKKRFNLVTIVLYIYLIKQGICSFIWFCFRAKITQSFQFFFNFSKNSKVVAIGKNFIPPLGIRLFRLERMDDGYFEKFGGLIKDCIHKDQAELEKVYYL